MSKSIAITISIIICISLIFALINFNCILINFISFHSIKLMLFFVLCSFFFVVVLIYILFFIYKKKKKQKIKNYLYLDFFIMPNLVVHLNRNELFYSKMKNWLEKTILCLFNLVCDSIEFSRWFCCWRSNISTYPSLQNNEKKKNQMNL